MTSIEQFNEWMQSFNKLLDNTFLASPDARALARSLATGISIAAYNPVKEAREVLIRAFKDDPAFRQCYVDNIACVIMDFETSRYREPDSPASMSHDLRNQLADRILKHLLA